MIFLSIAAIPFSAWITGVIVGIFLSFVILSIPSFVNMFKIGWSEYFTQLKLLWILNKKVKNSYSITETRTYSFIYPNGQSVAHQCDEISFYFPIFIRDDKVIIIQKRGNDFYNNLVITECNQNENQWLTKEHEIKIFSCILMQLLRDRFQKKLNILSKNSTQLENIDNFNEFINKELTILKRDNRLKNLLND